MLNIKPCHRCKDRGDVRVEPELAGYGYIVYCDNCSGGEYEVSHGWTRDKAGEAWNEAVQERMDEECDEEGHAPIADFGKLWGGIRKAGVDEAERLWAEHGTVGR